MTEHDTAGLTEAGAPACSLAPSALQGRIGAWRPLAAQALTRQLEQGRVRTTYPNSAPVARRLAQLIDAEKECCSFLEFHVRERDDLLEVELQVPPGVRPHARACVISPLCRPAADQLLCRNQRWSAWGPVDACWHV